MHGYGERIHLRATKSRPSRAHRLEKATFDFHALRSIYIYICNIPLGLVCDLREQYLSLTPYLYPRMPPSPLYSSTDPPPPPTTTTKSRCGIWQRSEVEPRAGKSPHSGIRGNKTRNGRFPILSLLAQFSFALIRPYMYDSFIFLFFALTRAVQFYIYRETSAAGRNNLNLKLMGNFEISLLLGHWFPLLFIFFPKTQIQSTDALSSMKINC